MEMSILPCFISFTCIRLLYDFIVFDRFASFHTILISFMLRMQISYAGLGKLVLRNRFRECLRTYLTVKRLVELLVQKIE